MERSNGTYYMKPMNCPMHCLTFRSRQRSYRELPLRLFELGTVYRSSAPARHGLMRIHGFTEDDFHISLHPRAGARRDRLVARLCAVGAAAFRFDRSRSTCRHGPAKFVGTEEGWRRRRPPWARCSNGTDQYQVDQGDAAFYGRDRHRRARRHRPPWQLRPSSTTSTARAGRVKYVGEASPHPPDHDGSRLFGSVECFFGVLLEDYAGAADVAGAGAGRVLASRPPGARRHGRRRLRRPAVGSTRSAPTSSSASGSARPSWKAAVHPRRRRRRRGRRDGRRGAPRSNQPNAAWTWPCSWSASPTRCRGRPPRRCRPEPATVLERLRNGGERPTSPVAGRRRRRATT